MPSSSGSPPAAAQRTGTNGSTIRNGLLGDAIMPDAWVERPPPPRSHDSPGVGDTMMRDAWIELPFQPSRTYSNESGSNGYDYPIEAGRRIHESPASTLDRVYQREDSWEVRGGRTVHQASPIDVARPSNGQPWRGGREDESNDGAVQHGRDHLSRSQISRYDKFSTPHQPADPGGRFHEAISVTSHPPPISIPRDLSQVSAQEFVPPKYRGFLDTPGGANPSTYHVVSRSNIGVLQLPDPAHSQPVHLNHWDNVRQQPSPASEHWSTPPGQPVGHQPSPRQHWSGLYEHNDGYLAARRNRPSSPGLSPGRNLRGSTSPAIDPWNARPQTPLVSHHDYERSEDVPYKSIRGLGHGAFGVVDEIEAAPGRAPVQGRFARKIIKIPPSVSSRVREHIRNEVDIVKRLSHHHIVQVVATYSERRRFGVIMTPIADMNLEEYFESNPNPPQNDKMYCWFGCLATGLDYLHTQRIKHRDIKPANILVQGDRILYTDFGVARDVLEEVTTSTAGLVDGKSPMYCSPEVATEGRRGRLSDVFSLGCVFLEMATVLMWDYEVSIEDLHNFKETDGKRAYSANLGKTLNWILTMATRLMLYKYGESSSYGQFWTNGMHDMPARERQLCFALEWCIAMLQPKPSDRISASQLIQLVQGVNHNSRNASWIGSCCRTPMEYLPLPGDLMIVERWPDIPRLGLHDIPQPLPPTPGGTPYMYFVSEQAELARRQYPRLNLDEIDIVLEGKWNVLDWQQRAPYKDKAVAEHERYLTKRMIYCETIANWGNLSLWDKANNFMGYRFPLDPIESNSLHMQDY
ncbi:MAG: hypothetical protein M1813_008986 [Trichoglossum hirsutum]|nr:MAG: hypothetical protein M1813_008986 [Trichoglossum hirsutum]